MAVKKIVETKFSANDKITKRFSLMERAAARFGRNTEKSFKRANRGASRFRTNTKAIVAGLGISRGLGLLSQGVGSVVTQFIAFDKAALSATVRFRDIGPEASNFAEKLKEIQKAARDVGAITEFTAAQAAAGLDKLAVSGFNSEEAIGSLKGIIDVATATGEDFARVADIQSDLLGAFGLNADNAAQKIKNMNRLNDVMVKTANSANVTLETMFDTMVQIGPIATQLLGASLEEVAALVGTLGNSGIKGSNAMTALKNAYLRLAAPTSEARKVLAEFGVSMKDATTGEARKLTDILEELGIKMKGLDPTTAAGKLDIIFGKRAIAGSKNLMGNVASIRELEKSLLAAGLTAQLTADIIRKSIDNKLKALGSTATEAGFKILDAFQVEGKGGIDALTESIRNFDVKPLIEGLTIVLNTVKLIAKSTAFVFNKLVKLGAFAGETAAKTAIALGVDRESLNETSFGDRFKPNTQERTGPNQQEAAAKAKQQAMLKATLNVNAPAGSTMDVEQSSDGFNTQLLGKN